MIDRELEKLQRICEALGDESPLTAELWSEAVSLSVDPVLGTAG